MATTGNFQIHCKGKIGDKEIDFTLDTHSDPAEAAKAYFNEAYITPWLAQIAMELEFQVKGTSSEWSIESHPLAEDPRQMA